MVDMQDYTGTKIALQAYVIYALLVLHYYRLVLLSRRTIGGFISILCAERLYSPLSSFLQMQEDSWYPVSEGAMLN